MPGVAHEGSFSRQVACQTYQNTMQWRTMQNRLLQQCSEMRETKLWANQVLSWAMWKGPYEM